MTTKEKVIVIENNFKEYFNASWLINYIYTSQNVKVAINLETLEVYCIAKNVIDINQNILYLKSDYLSSLFLFYH